MTESASAITDEQDQHQHEERDRIPASGPRIVPSWLERACIIVPAFDAEGSIAEVISGLMRAIPERKDAIIVVDDGSVDATARIARDLGCTVVTSSATGARRSDAYELDRPANRGKGAALRAGLETARARGMSIALTVDADGQHPPEEARRVLFASANDSALVLGVRDLARDGAPRANRFSNGISNFFLSRFARRPLHDTQCGLRRYPVRETLALRTSGQGYDFEAEVLLRAIWSGLDVVEQPVRVIYPEHRKTHFRTGRDVRRIIRTVVASVGDHWMHGDGSNEDA